MESNKIPRLIKHRHVIDERNGNILTIDEAYEICGSRGRIGWSYFLKMLNPNNKVRNSTVFEYVNKITESQSELLGQSSKTGQPNIASKC